MAAKRPHIEDVARRKAMETIMDIAALYFQDSPLIRRMLADGEVLDSGSPSFVAALAVKSTGTLSKRAVSLRMYSAWFRTTSYEAQDFFKEAAVFAHLSSLHADGAPATRAAALCAAINFAGGVFSIPVLEVTQSSRVKGITCKLLRTREAVRQRRPLTVEMVRSLEKLLVAEASSGTVDAIIAGSALFAVFARARVGDLRRGNADLHLDLSKDGLSGFIETRFLDHKCARPGSRRALPVAAPARGVGEDCWASAWVTARKAAKIDVDSYSVMLPALDKDLKWLNVSYTTPEFAAAVRTTLIRCGFSADDLVNIGAHSLKSTCLSWLAKFGAPRDERRLLGYHAVPGDKSLDSYSRDTLAGPLRTLCKMLGAIRAGTFDPDETRSGTFTSAAPAPPGPPVAPLALADGRASSSSTCSSSRSSSSAAASDDLIATELVDKSASMLINVTTKFVHVISTDAVLACGKQWPFKYNIITEPPTGAKLCPRCF